MMGQQTGSESLFYYFRIEDQIPEDHLLRLIDWHIDFAFVRVTLKTSYSHTDRPSVDPEVLLRTWRIAGSQDWNSISRSRTTRRSRRVGMAVFRSRRSSSTSSSESFSSA